MITAAAICPPAPLLARELTGLDSVIPALRRACAAAVGRLVRSAPEIIAVVGPGRRTAAWPADGRLDLTPFAPALSTRDGPPGPPLPLPLGLGARLLDEAGYRGTRLFQSISQDEPAAPCLRLGVALRSVGDRAGLLVMADGSACRSLRAPGYLHPRAAAFDAAVERAVRTGDLGSLQVMDRGLARELLATAATGWQVLAGAMPRAAATGIQYADDPFGVFYLAAWLAGEPSPDSRPMHGGIGQPPGGRGTVHLRQPGDELGRLDRPAGPAPVLAGRPPAAQPLHPVPVHPEHLAGQPGRGVRGQVDDEPGGVGRILRIEARRRGPPGTGFRTATPGTPSVILVRAIGEIAFAVTPYLAISSAVIVVSETMPAFAAP